MEMLLTVEQAAQRLQVAQSTVRRFLANGELRGLKRGKLWRIPESALTETRDDATTAKTQASALSPMARALAMKPVKSSGPVDAVADLEELRATRTEELAG